MLYATCLYLSFDEKNNIDTFDIEFDLAKSDKIRMLIEKIHNKFGRIEGLISVNSEEIGLTKLKAVSPPLN